MIVLNSNQAFADLAERLDEAMGRDRAGFRRRLRGLERRAARGLPCEQGLERLAAAIETSTLARERRSASALRIDFDDALPITAHRDAIREAIASHPVIVVAGETGSGKTTQLPKICLDAGRGRDGWIGVTQPRRIAARSIAARLAEELGCKVGAEVGFKVRFDEKGGADSLIKVMTDGILLAETQRDRWLDAYDTLIVDEAHERSLNIDFLLGYLKRLLARRPELKLIVTSATIDTARFAAHFDDAPVIEVSGRGHPVEYRYRPLAGEESGEPERDLIEGICAAVEELGQLDPRGDILVFLPGERDIRDAGEALDRMRLRRTEILPLYARLGRHRQHRIFHPGPARRIVLATNVAETSLTVPRIRFVIDSGLARISRYSHRSKVQRLPIEAISQASAAQRAGRCGRLSPGTCIRLYGETDFESRPLYTEPEILRTNLATVILMMESLGLGSVEEFPFLEPPAARFVNDGYQLLFELGALDGSRKLTAIGRDMAQWPLDVRLARLLLAGRDGGCLNEALVIASFLSLQDPRERPLDAAKAADAAHAHWHDEASDFAAVMNLWRAWTQVRRGGSNRTRRDWCREHFLNPLRMREWSDVHTQLRDQARESRWPLAAGAADYVSLHRALTSAFLGHIGLKDEREYVGARQQRFSIFPGSGLFGRGPRWLLSALKVETARVYARMNARIEPEWAEAAGAHLVKRRTFDPYWSRRAGRVLGYEQVTLYGLPLVVKRRIHYGAVEPEAAREIFIRDALVEGKLASKAKFLAHNRALIEQVQDLEARQRRRDLLTDLADLFEFFDGLVPSGMCTAKAFERWRREAEKKRPKLLYLDRERVLARADHGVDGARFPDRLEIDSTRYRLVYELAPGEPSDGVNLQLPLHRLNTLDPAPLEWLVPGLLGEKVTALIKSLPKALRKNFVPAPDYASRFLGQATDRKGALSAALADFLFRDTGVAVEPDDFQTEQLDDHLRINIQLRDGRALVAQGRDLMALKRAWGEDAREEFLTQNEGEYYRDGLDRWSFGALPEQIELADGATAFPALVDQEGAAGIRLFEDRASAADYHLHGLRRLVALALKDKFRYLARSLPLDAEMCLRYAPIDSPTALKRDLIFAVSMASVEAFAERVRDAETFARLSEHVRGDLLERAHSLTETLREVLAEFTEVRQHLSAIETLHPLTHSDISEQLGYLLYPGFLTEVSGGRLAHYSRYLRAICVRLQRLEQDPGRDLERADRISGFWADYLERCAGAEDYPNELDEFHWLLEEYRVSLFAQELKTAVPVSAKRLRAKWAKIPGPRPLAGD